MQVFVVYKVLAFLVALATIASSLNIQEVEERYPKWDIYTADPKIDHNWEASIKVWYIPMWNKVEMYKFAGYFKGEEELKKMTDADTDKICAYNVYNGTDYDEWHGFGDKIVKLRGYDHHLRPLQVEYTIVNEDGGESGFLHESRTVLTDNKSFTLEVVLWNDNLLGFKVFTTEPKIEPEVEREIKMKVLSLGFKEPHIVIYNYEKNCPGLKEQMEKWKSG